MSDVHRPTPPHDTPLLHHTNGLDYARGHWNLGAETKTSFHSVVLVGCERLAEQTPPASFDNTADTKKELFKPWFNAKLAPNSFRSYGLLSYLYTI